MSLPQYDKSRLFLVSLGRSCKPLNEALKEVEATMYSLGLWFRNERFARKLKRVLRRRRQIHDLSTTLTRIWAADQYAERLQQSVIPESPTADDAEKAARDRKTKQDAAILEFLRKASQAPSRKVASEVETQQRSFVHPDVPAAEQAALIDLLSQSESEPPTKKAA